MYEMKISEQEWKLWHSSQKIEAIKAYRARYNSFIGSDPGLLFVKNLFEGRKTEPLDCVGPHDLINIRSIQVGDPGRMACRRCGALFQRV